jgi:hypothetical protein
MYLPTPFSLAGTVHNTRGTYDANLIRCCPCSKAKVFFQFSRMHANAADPSAISHFLKALGLSSSDLPALRFWTSGLTKEVYKCCWVQQALDVRHRGLTIG